MKYDLAALKELQKVGNKQYQEFTEKLAKPLIVLEEKK